MSEKLKVTRRHLTVADKLAAVEELSRRESERLDAKVAAAQADLAAAKDEREARLAELAQRRAEIVKAHEAKIAEMKRQLEGPQP